MARVDMDLSHDKTQDDFTPVPPGDYDLKIVDSEVIETKNGMYLAAVFKHEIVSPPEFRGHRLRDQLNIKGLKRDANEIAIRIGREALKTMATVGGHKNPNFVRDTEELHGMIVGAKVEIQDNGEYNEVKRYKKPQHPASPTSPTQQKQTQQQETKPDASIPPEVAAQATQQAPQQAKFPWQKA